MNKNRCAPVSFRSAENKRAKMMLNPEGIPLGGNGTEAAPDPNAALRFEDLTIDDDLSLIDQVVRYVQSGIALQRLVHVKMLSDTAKTYG